MRQRVSRKSKVPGPSEAGPLPRGGETRRATNAGGAGHDFGRVSVFPQAAPISQAPASVQREGDETDPRLADPDRGTYLDHALGLNPDKSFVESGLDWLYGKDSILHPNKGDSDGKMVGKALGAAASVPLAAGAVFGGEVLDIVGEVGGSPATGPFNFLGLMPEWGEQARTNQERRIGQSYQTFNQGIAQDEADTQNDINARRDQQIDESLTR